MNVKMNECVKFFTLTKWWFARTLLLHFFLIPFQEAGGQILQPQRLEYPLANGEQKFDIVSSDESGLYLYRTFETDVGDQMQLIRLDTSLKEKFQGFLPIEKNYLLMGKRAYKENLYLLFRFNNYTRNDFLLYIVHQDGNYSRYMIKGYIPITPSEFQITDEAVLIGGYYNRVPLVLYYSLKKFQSRVLPGLFNENGELTQVRTYEDGTFDVLISALNHLKQRTIWIKSYDPEGNLNRNFSLETNDNKHLIFGRSIKTRDNAQIIAGVYGSRSTEYSHGIFIASIDASGIQQIRYYHFGDLENFFKYMKAKREERVKNRIERRKIKGKKIRLNYRFLVHELVSFKDQYILLGEAFYPKYRSIENGTYGGPFFSPSFYRSGGIIRNGRIFEGYFYTHAVVMGFNPEGDLTWDNSFEINDVRTFTLEQFVKLQTYEDQIAMVYLFDNTIRTKIIKNNEVIEGKSNDPIRTGSSDETVSKNSSDFNRLEYWYSDYLFAYGIQEIEKAEKAEKSKNATKRRVFYINKIKQVR